MKRFIALFLTLLLLLCGCGREAAPTEPPTEETEAIIEETGPEAIVEPEDVTEPVPTETVQLLVRTTALDAEGNESWYQEYTYDDYGREIQTTQYMDGETVYFANTVYASVTEYEMFIQQRSTAYSVRCICDEAGRLLRQETIHEDGTVDVSEHTYDDQGSELTMKSLYSDGTEINLSYTYIYDNQGNPLTREEYYNGEPVGKLETAYDEEGREISSIYCYPDGSVNYTTESTWEGTTETRISRDSDGHAYITMVTAYDENGSILSRETWQEDVMVSRTFYTYEYYEIIAN